MSSARAASQSNQRLDGVFHALADTTRRQLVSRLSRGPTCVSELAAPFSVSLAAVSKHLDVLERAGLVRRERAGRFQRCHLNPEPLDDASRFIELYRTFWEGTLDQLAAYVEEAEQPAKTRAKRSKK